VRGAKVFYGVLLFLGLSALTSGPLTKIYGYGQATLTNEVDNWPVYGGRTTDDHYSKLSRINRTNVENLTVAWTFDTGESGRDRTGDI
jgi:glucose dehydrogenase